MLRELIRKSNGIDFARPFCLAYSGLDDALLNRYIADSQDLYISQTSTLPVARVGSVIGTYVASGAVAIAFFARD